MKARIKWTEGAQFVASSDSGHAVVMDGPVDGGGKNLGLRPMEMVLLGTGGCTAYDVVDILKKSRQPVRDCVVEIEADRALRRIIKTLEPVAHRLSARRQPIEQELYLRSLGQAAHSSSGHTVLNKVPDRNRLQPAASRSRNRRASARSAAWPARRDWASGSMPQRSA